MYISKYKKALVVSIFCFISLISNADCENNYHSLQNEKKYCQLSYSKLGALARSGDAEAQFMLGRIYEKGLGVEINHKRSCYWYRKATKNSHLNAMYNLAQKYKRGEGVVKDLDVAFELIKSAAKLGSAHAQYNLAVNAYEERSDKKLLSEAFDLLKKSAESGDSLAQYNLGRYYLYDKGDRGIQSYKKARYWYEKSANSNNLDAQYGICYLYDRGLGVQRDMKVARSWCSKAAKEKHIDSLLLMGLWEYETSPISQKSIKKAIFWWKQAANQGDSNAYYFLSLAYKKLLQNTVSQEWLIAAAKAGNKYAIKKLSNNKQQTKKE